MDCYKEFSLEDFEPEDFQNPLALLDALKEKKEAFSLSVDKEGDYFYGTEAPSDDLLSITDIEQRYHVSIETIRSAIVAKRLAPVTSIPFFSLEDVIQFIEETKASFPPIVTTFLEEIEHMRTNYSYKPLLLMAIMEKASENGEIMMKDIIDYYFSYYGERCRKGLRPEKSDSSFVRCPDDRRVAKRTIVKYPLKIYIGKGFLTYDSTTGVVNVDKTLWAYAQEVGRERIKENCEILLKKYYLTSFS